MLNLSEKYIQSNCSLKDISKRAPVYIGFKCNQRCFFCYYLDRIHEEFLSLEHIKKSVDILYDYGIRDFEITGGEPGIFKELNTLIYYIKSKHNTKVAVITNGALKRESIELVDEVLISFHALSDKENIDIVGTSLSNVLKCIENVKELNKLLRFNIVVGYHNIHNLKDIVKKLAEYVPFVVNFLPLNTWNHAGTLSKSIDYSLIRTMLKECIDILSERNIHSFIRFMPYCDMTGYEKHLIGNFQHVFDHFDWNPNAMMISAQHAEGNFLQGKLSFSSSFTSIDEIRKETYTKSSKCLTCKYQILCDGPEKSVDFVYKPEHGHMIKDIAYYISTYIEKMYKGVYSDLPS